MEKFKCLVEKVSKIVNEKMKQEDVWATVTDELGEMEELVVLHSYHEIQSKRMDMEHGDSSTELLLEILPDEMGELCSSAPRLLKCAGTQQQYPSLSHPGQSQTGGPLPPFNHVSSTGGKETKVKSEGNDLMVVQINQITDQNQILSNEIENQDKTNFQCKINMAALEKNAKAIQHSILVSETTLSELCREMFSTQLELVLELVMMTIVTLPPLLMMILCLKIRLHLQIPN